MKKYNLELTEEMLNALKKNLTVKEDDVQEHPSLDDFTETCKGEFIDSRKDKMDDKIIPPMLWGGSLLKEIDNLIHFKTDDRLRKIEIAINQAYYPERCNQYHSCNSNYEIMQMVFKDLNLAFPCPDDFEVLLKRYYLATLLPDGFETKMETKETENFVECRYHKRIRDDVIQDIFKIDGNQRAILNRYYDIITYFLDNKPQYEKGKKELMLVKYAQMPECDKVDFVNTYPLSLLFDKPTYRNIMDAKRIVANEFAKIIFLFYSSNGGYTYDRF